jgi:predicted NAD/FAD-dependent oxidoreductase
MKVKRRYLSELVKLPAAESIMARTPATPDVTVVGAGLAGLTAALRLAERGCHVVLIESAARPGGKAGADANGRDFDDHGYHVFPAWYLNTWRLVDELGIRERFVDCKDFVHMRPDRFPERITFLDLTSPAALWNNVLSGLTSPAEIVLFYYSSLDLASQPYQYRSFLDQISVNGFVRSRFYRTEQLALAHQEFILKGLSVPSYDLSAMTLRNIIRLWLRYPKPMYRILDGNMQERFIEPLADRLCMLGCSIRTSQQVERLDIKGTRVTHLGVRNLTTGRLKKLAVTNVILAIPHARVAALITDDVYARAPNLAKVRYLESRPMAALDLFLTRKIPHLPRYHVNCLNSRYGLSFIDVSQTWEPPLDTTTILQVIASDYTPLLGLSEADATRELVSDLSRFLPDVIPEVIRKSVLMPHDDQPLFANSVGAWAFRPAGPTDLDNLQLAGDYCRTEVDVVCQEGAVLSGLRAAEATRLRLGIASPVCIEIPSIPPQWLLTLAKVALSPLAVLSKALTMLPVIDQPETAVTS